MAVPVKAIPAYLLATCLVPESQSDRVSQEANGSSPFELPARENFTHQTAEELLARMAEALPGAGVLVQLAGLLSSGKRRTNGAGKAQARRAETRYRALVEQIPAVTLMAALDG